MIKSQLWNFKKLSIDYGQLISIKKDIPLDKQRNPIPWYTYPAIEYLSRLDFSSKSIFEWGSGNSSVYWARKAKKVVSIENDRYWFNVVNASKSANQKILLIESKNEYIDAIINQKEKYDILIIDGKYRYECSLKALEHIHKIDMIILDNSDWFPKTAANLRNADMTQIDFSGFGPINNYTWTTSLFIKDNSNIRSYGYKHSWAIGGLRQYAEE